MVVSFLEPTAIASSDDIRQLRAKWMQALGSWHSPYKALIDCENLTVKGTPDMAEEWKRLHSFLKGFFMKSAVLFNFDETKGHSFMPFDHETEEASARRKVGLAPKLKGESLDFRSNITIANHFQQHVMELSFENPAALTSKEELEILKSKITNNLMQWHSAWSLLIDCAHFEIHESQREPFKQMVAYFQSFFLKKVLGYSPSRPKEDYPFDVYRARHAAAGRLESEGLVSGQDANCNSRK